MDSMLVVDCYKSDWSDYCHGHGNLCSPRKLYSISDCNYMLSLTMIQLISKGNSWRNNLMILLGGTLEYLIIILSFVIRVVTRIGMSHNCVFTN